MAMGCPHQGRSGGLNATITSRPFDSPRPSPGGYHQGAAHQGRASRRHNADRGGAPGATVPMDQVHTELETRLRRNVAR